MDFQPCYALEVHVVGSDCADTVSFHHGEGDGVIDEEACLRSQVR